MASGLIVPRVGRWIGRRPILSVCLALGALAAVILFAPVWPYQPHCGLYGSASWRSLDGEITTAFRDELADWFRLQETPHIVIGDRIYVQFLLWLDGEVSADTHVYRSLLGPKASSYPPFFEEDCDLIRRLALQDVPERQVH
jgi:hypothetical protein